MTDEELAVKAQEGNLAATYELWDREKILICKLVRSEIVLRDLILRRAGLNSCDIEQIAYLVLAESIRKFRPKDGYKLSTYYTHTIQEQVRIAFGFGKSGRKSDALAIAHKVDSNDIDRFGIEEIGYSPEPYVELEIRTKLESNLKPMQKEMLNAHLFQGQGIKQLAAKYRRSRATVSRNIKRAKIMLRSSDCVGDMKELFDEWAYYSGLAGTGLKRYVQERSSATERTAIKLYEMDEENEYDAILSERSLKFKKPREVRRDNTQTRLLNNE